MEHIFKEVRFDMYCENCKNKDVKDVDEPCNECLEHPYNEHSRKPVNYKERDDR